jgi:hypothetical protein
MFFRIPMLRSLLVIVVLLLCSNALADRHHVAKSYLAGGIIDAAECRISAADDDDLPLSLSSKSAYITLPNFAINSIVYHQQVDGPQLTSGASPIRAPPYTL